MLLIKNNIHKTDIAHKPFYNEAYLFRHFVSGGFLKRVSTRVWIYQYTLQGARNGSDYCEMSFLGALSETLGFLAA